MFILHGKMKSWKYGIRKQEGYPPKMANKILEFDKKGETDLKISQIERHYQEFSEWANSLKELTEEQWSTSISEGKWTVGAVVAHLLFWDRYSLQERFPFFMEGAELTSFPDFQQVNDRARKYAEEEVSKNQIIDELIEVRKEYLDLLSRLTEEDLSISFKIGQHTLTVGGYFEDFIQHDLHHQKQVMEATGTSAATK